MRYFWKAMESRTNIESNFRYHKMGTQLCSQPKSCSSQQEPSSLLAPNESSSPEPSCLHDEDILQEFDNPSRGLLDLGFLNTNITASNQRLEEALQHLPPQSMAINSPVQQVAKEEYASIYRIESSELSIGKDEWDEVFNFDSSQQNGEGGEEEEVSTRKRKASVESRIEVEEVSLSNVESNESILKQVSGFVLSSKQIFDPIPVTKEDFIKFRKEQIEKHYSFVEKIGEGSFGNVFKVFHKASKEFRAIKILKKSAISKLQTNKIMREIDILKKVDHPHILKIYEVFFYQSNYYIVTEHCEGGTLSRLLRSDLAPGLATVRQIVAQLMGALSYLHKMGVIHRDIKLDNILLKKKRGGEGEVDIRLIDFGLSKEIKVKRLKDREKIGTHTYMAPEVIEGVYSSKCDMWSVGIVLITLISGKNPFKGRTKDQTFQKIKNESLAFKGELWKEVELPAKQVIIGLLQKDPRLRLSAEQVLASRWLSGRKQGSKEMEDFGSVARKLYDYYRGNNFVTVVESYIAYMTTSEKELQEYSKYFQALDSNRDGYIQKQELRNLFQSSASFFSEAELRYVLEKVETQYEEGINFTQFVAHLSDRSRIYARQSLVQAFQYLDENSNGYIEKGEMRKILKGFNSSELSYIVAELDQNNDERISLEEFISYLKRENPGH